MSRRPDSYRRGDWAAICDICGFEYLASDLRRNWRGLYVCHKDWEPRETQDFVRGRTDRQAPPWTRPEPTPDTFTNGAGGYWPADYVVVDPGAALPHVQAMGFHRDLTLSSDGTTFVDAGQKDVLADVVDYGGSAYVRDAPNIVTYPNPRGA
jgi:hypothetical protein